MSEERITAQDLRDFTEGRTGPAGDLYTHLLGKLLELIDPDLRRIFLADLLQHAKGTTNQSMALTFRTIAKIQAVVQEELAAVPSDDTIVGPS